MILLKPREVDAILRYPSGRTVRLIQEGLLPHVILPDGEMRIRKDTMDALLTNCTKGAEHV